MHFRCTCGRARVFGYWFRLRGIWCAWSWCFRGFQSLCLCSIWWGGFNRRHQETKAAVCCASNRDIVGFGQASVFQRLLTSPRHWADHPSAFAKRGTSLYHEVSCKTRQAPSIRICHEGRCCWEVAWNHNLSLACVPQCSRVHAQQSPTWLGQAWVEGGPFQRKPGHWWHSSFRQRLFARASDLLCWHRCAPHRSWRIPRWADMATRPSFFTSTWPIVRPGPRSHRPTLRSFVFVEQWLGLMSAADIFTSAKRAAVQNVTCAHVWSRLWNSRKGIVKPTGKRASVLIPTTSSLSGWTGRCAGPWEACRTRGFRASKPSPSGSLIGSSWDFDFKRSGCQISHWKFLGFWFQTVKLSLEVLGILISNGQAVKVFKCVRMMQSSIATNLLCVMQDGMDQAKFQCPRVRGQPLSKAWSKLYRPKLHVGGTWAHGQCLHLSVSDEDFPKDAVAEMEQLVHAIGRLVLSARRSPLWVELPCWQHLPRAQEPPLRRISHAHHSAWRLPLDNGKFSTCRPQRLDKDLDSIFGFRCQRVVCNNLWWVGSWRLGPGLLSTSRSDFETHIWQCQWCDSDLGFFEPAKQSCWAAKSSATGAGLCGVLQAGWSGRLEAMGQHGRCACQGTPPLELHSSLTCFWYLEVLIFDFGMFLELHSVTLMLECFKVLDCSSSKAVLGKSDLSSGRTWILLLMDLCL